MVFARSLWLLALAFAGVSLSFSQEKSGGTVVYAEGKEFSIVRAGTIVRFPLNDDTHLGYAIINGDLLQTGASTFVEVQLKPKGTMLKIAENSSFVFQGIGGEKSETSLNLLYGRVRAKVAKISGTESFTIRSKGTTAGVRGTDFGFDSILSPSAASGTATSASSIRVYAFSGEVAVAPYAPESSSAVAPVVSVKAGELVVLDVSSAVPLVERRSVDDDIKTYWLTNDFKGKPPITPPESANLSVADQPKPSLPSTQAPTAAVKTADTEIRFGLPDFRPYKSALFSKNTAIVAAIVFNSVGFAVQGVGAFFIASGNVQTGTYMVLGGGALVGVSVVTLVSSLFVKTP